jgi:hypothetical protein
MPEQLQGVLYTAVAVVEGGREGHGRSPDGRLLSVATVDGVMLPTGAKLAGGVIRADGST